MRALLDEASGIVQQLLDVMDQETECLGNRNSDPLQELSQRKVVLIAELEQLEQRRRERVAAAGCDAETTDGMQAYLDQADDEDLTAQWNDFVVSLAALRARNEVNGTIIHRSIEGVQRDLALLNGYAPGTANVYDRQGRQKPPTGRRISSA